MDDSARRRHSKRKPQPIHPAEALAKSWRRRPRSSQGCLRQAISGPPGPPVPKALCAGATWACGGRTLKQGKLLQRIRQKAEIRDLPQERPAVFWKPHWISIRSSTWRHVRFPVALAAFRPDLPRASCPLSSGSPASQPPTMRSGAKEPPGAATWPSCLRRVVRSLIRGKDPGSTQGAAPPAIPGTINERIHRNHATLSFPSPAEKRVLARGQRLDLASGLSSLAPQPDGLASRRFHVCNICQAAWYNKRVFQFREKYAGPGGKSPAQPGARKYRVSVRLKIAPEGGTPNENPRRLFPHSPKNQPTTKNTGAEKFLEPIDRIHF